MSESKHRVQSITVEDDGRLLALGWRDGNSSRYHAVWLRANSQGDNCIDSSSGQRLTSIANLPNDCRVHVASVNADGGIFVTFTDHDNAEQDTFEFECSYTPSWLWANQYDRMPALPKGWIDPALSLWDADIEIETPAYSDIMNDDAALKEWLSGLHRFGVARLRDCPRTSGEVNRIAERFGFVRETNYGRYFDVESVADPINLAYTTQALEVHTDNPYRDPVPGLQLLLALETTAEGGDSIIVDGFSAAHCFRDTDPQSFHLLTEHCVGFEFHTSDIALNSKAPVISLNVEGQIVQIRHNNRAIRPTRLPFDVTADWYGAQAKFARLLNEPERQLRIHLGDGDLLVMNNHRTLHGRAAFNLDKGKRHLQGCYMDNDSLTQHRTTNT